ncbi:MAG: hypothetical protein PHZ03_07835 [Syntrophomonas sp.]|nr:hypothetical protein [Syntrophomonas sp.]
MAKDKKRPMDQGGIYKDGAQKNQDDTLNSPNTPPSAKKRKINESI